MDQIVIEFGPDAKPLGYNRVIAELNDQKRKTAESARRFEDRKNLLTNRGVSPSGISQDQEITTLFEAFESNKRTLEKMENALDTGDVFGDNIPTENGGYIACESSISLADLYDIRFEVPKTAPRLIIENYEDTSSAFTVGEGETIGEFDLLDCVHSFAPDRSDCKKLASILSAPEQALDDDPILRDTALINVQAKHTANGENVLLLTEILNSKEAVSISANTLYDKCNTTLSANAKRRAEIITNETGFTLLDGFGLDGNLLIKKDFTIGEFVFQGRYIVRVLPDTVLPNFENGSSPVLVGDWANVLRLIVVLKFPLVNKNDLFNFLVKNKAVEKVIPVLTTTSDKAFFVGCIGPAEEYEPEEDPEDDPENEPSNEPETEPGENQENNG